MKTTTFAILSLDAALLAMDAIDAAASAAAPGSDILAFLLGDSDALPAGGASAAEHMFDIRIDYTAPIGPRPACPACDGRGVLREAVRPRGQSTVKLVRGECRFCRGCGADTGNHTPAILASVTPARGSNIYNRYAA